MQNAAFADVARDCGLDPDDFGDEYAYADHNVAYSYSHDQPMYRDDPISDYTDDLGKCMRLHYQASLNHCTEFYSSPSPFVPRRRTMDTPGFSPDNPPRSQFMPTMAQLNPGQSQEFRAQGSFQAQDPYLLAGSGQPPFTHHRYGPDAGGYMRPTVVGILFSSFSIRTADACHTTPRLLQSPEQPPIFAC
jgi:hypothetical protein